MDGGMGKCSGQKKYVNKERVERTRGKRLIRGRDRKGENGKIEEETEWEINK